MLDWLERSWYESLDERSKAAARRQALIPNLEAPEPEVYRLYRLTERTGLPPVAGGALDQPYVLNLELAAVHNAIAQFAQEAHLRGIPSQQQQPANVAFRESS